MVHIDESIVKIHRGYLRRHFGVVSGARIAITQDNVVQPVGNDAFCVHQFPDGLQNRLEVVFFGLAPHKYVEAFKKAIIMLD